MGRLARHLFTLCSAVSLLLCVAVCALWVRSYHLADSVGHSGLSFGDVDFIVISVRGQLGGRWSPDTKMDEVVEWRYVHNSRERDPDAFEGLPSEDYDRHLGPFVLDRDVN